MEKRLKQTVTFPLRANDNRASSNHYRHAVVFSSSTSMYVFCLADLLRSLAAPLKTERYLLPGKLKVELWIAL